MTTTIGRVIFVLLFAYIPTIYAQEDIQYLQHYGVEDGLSSTQVTAFYNDSRGYMWFGTSYGINRFDGTRFISYTEEQGLPHNYVLWILEDDLGNILIRSGDFTFNETYWSVLNPITEEIIPLEEYLVEPSPFLSKNYLGILSNETGVSIFFETLKNKHHLYQLKNRSIRKITTVDGKDNPRPIELPYQIEDDEISYISRTTNDSDFNNYSSKLNTYNINSGKTTEQSIDLGEYYDFSNLNGKIYYTAFKDGYKKGSLYEQNTFLANFDLGGDQNSLVKINEDLVVIISYETRSISVFDKNTQELLVKSQLGDEIELASFRIFLDNQNGIWFVGLDYISRLHFKQKKFSVPKIKRKANFSIGHRGIVSTNKNKIIASNDFGLTSLENEQLNYLFKYYGKLDFSQGMGMLLLDSLLLIGTEMGSVLKYNLDANMGLDAVSFSPIKDRTIIWQPYKDKQEKIWLGSAKGLYHYNLENGSKTPVKIDDRFSELASSSVYHFLETADGTWLSTSTGLYLFDTNKEKILAHYNNKKSSKFFLPCKHVAHTYQDKEGVLWLATKGQGLIKWDPISGDYSNYTKAKSGLSHNVIYAVYEDDFNNLWLPSNYGLMCFNKESENVIIYLTEDGLPNNEFNTISHHEDAEGNLYFGTIDGLVHFHPKDFNQEDSHFPFIISACYSTDKATDLKTNITEHVINDQSISLRPSHRAIELSFSLINFQKKEGIQYGYKIEPLHDQWNYVQEGKIRISEMGYGNYTIKLRAKPAGNRNWIVFENPIKLAVIKPFYLRWWFILSCFALLVSSILYYNRRSTKVLKERQAQLEKVVEERTEEIRLQAEELKVLDKVKSNFFANISHELRTPLTLILGPLSYILDSPEKMKEPEVIKQLMVMQRNGKNLMHLIEEILDLSKLEANKLELDLVPTNVKEFLEYIYFFFEPQFNNDQLNVDLRCNVDSNLTVLLDRKKMEKVLNNFLSNAIKFTSPGDQIIIEANEQDASIIFSVSDTGKGIHEKDLPYIFERFYQSKQADHKLYGGTGIGLALVKEYAQLMKGEVSAISNIGQGSSFNFSIPASKVEGRQNTPVIETIDPEIIIGAEEISLEGQKFTILIVEDNNDMRNFIEVLLSDLYHEILTAQNGAIALEIIAKRATDIHLVISDVMMPEVDGISLVKTVKSNNQWFTIPFIMLTALASERDKLAALTIGVDDYLTKPFSVPELLARVQNLLVNYYLRRQWWQDSNSLAKKDSEQKRIPAKPLNIQENQKVKQLIEEMKVYIESEIENGKIEVEALAKAFYISERQLNRNLKTYTGLTPAKFIKEVQMLSARKILEDGQFFSISEVAFRVGYEQASTFSTLFKARFGISPSSYKKSQVVENISN